VSWSVPFPSRRSRVGCSTQIALRFALSSSRASAPCFSGAWSRTAPELSKRARASAPKKPNARRRVVSPSNPAQGTILSRQTLRLTMPWICFSSSKRSLSCFRSMSRDSFKMPSIGLSLLQLQLQFCGPRIGRPVRSSNSIGIASDAMSFKSSRSSASDCASALCSAERSFGCRGTSLSVECA